MLLQLVEVMGKFYKLEKSSGRAQQMRDALLPLLQHAGLRDVLEPTERGSAINDGSVYVQAHERAMRYCILEVKVGMLRWCWRM